MVRPLSLAAEQTLPWPWRIAASLHGIKLRVHAGVVALGPLAPVPRQSGMLDMPAAHLPAYVLQMAAMRQTNLVLPDAAQ